MKMNFNLETTQDYLKADSEVRKEFLKKECYYNSSKLFDNEPCEENIAPNVQRRLDIYNQFVQLSYIKDSKGVMNKMYSTDCISGSLFLQVHSNIKRFNSELVEKYLTLNPNCA